MHGNKWKYVLEDSLEDENNSNSASNEYNEHPVETYENSHSESGRTKFKHYQIYGLRDFFEINKYPNKAEIKYLTRKLNLTTRVVSSWFQNQRHRSKMKEQAGESLISKMRSMRKPANIPMAK